jgi:hypothetical protein
MRFRFGNSLDRLQARQKRITATTLATHRPALALDIANGDQRSTMDTDDRRILPSKSFFDKQEWDHE